MNNTINIWFKGEAEGTISAPEDPGGQVSNETPVENTAGKRTKSSLTLGGAVGRYVLKQSITNTLSRVGTWTKDSSKDKAINAVTKLVGMGASFYLNPYMAAAATAISIATSIMDYNTNVTQEANRIAMINKRAGSDFNRSRD